MRQDRCGFLQSHTSGCAINVAVDVNEFPMYYMQNKQNCLNQSLFQTQQKPNTETRHSEPIGTLL